MIAYIPKGILTKIQKACFTFLWTVSKQNKGIPLVKWNIIAQPKVIGGWGIKNLPLFTKALAAKSLWRLIKNADSLWGRVVCSKYLTNMEITDWIRSPNKTYKHGSVGWKAMVLAFPLIGTWIAWELGNEKSIRIGLDPWAGEGEKYRIPQTILKNLGDQRCYKLADAKN